MQTTPKSSIIESNQKYITEINDRYRNGTFKILWVATKWHSISYSTDMIYYATLFYTETCFYIYDTGLSSWIQVIKKCAEPFGLQKWGLDVFWVWTPLLFLPLGLQSMENFVPANEFYNNRCYFFLMPLQVGGTGLKLVYSNLPLPHSCSISNFSCLITVLTHREAGAI